MRFTSISLILAVASLRTVITTPLGCSSPCTGTIGRVYYRSLPCEQQTIGCNQNVQVQPIIKAASTHTPLLRQVFTTITRKHDNLNTASASHRKGINFKYQTGPSLEAEGNAIAWQYAKQKGSESSVENPQLPSLMIVPGQTAQYSAPAEITECVAPCNDQIPVSTPCTENCYQG
ncbi:hypothetical protein K7432_018644 [Basidiobolus ranarum]|uniref:Secreted protein n=1 Tax=Basidiobolus ranarum TaxID=34480 RepID=A0ABR2VTF2_9FUNG